MIAAIIKRGMIMNRKVLRASLKSCVNFPFLFELVFKTLTPILSPNAIDMITAGSSKIPWGRILQRTRTPSSATVWCATKPRR